MSRSRLPSGLSSAAVNALAREDPLDGVTARDRRSPAQVRAIVTVGAPEDVREKRLNAVALREERDWRDVETRVATKKPSPAVGFVHAARRLPPAGRAGDALVRGQMDAACLLGRTPVNVRCTTTPCRQDLVFWAILPHRPGRHPCLRFRRGGRGVAAASR